MKPTNSKLWKSIVVWLKIDKYNMWSIGDDRDVNTWNDIWIAPNIHIYDLQFVIHMHTQNANVTDIANKDAGQNWEDINNCLPMDML